MKRKFLISFLVSLLIFASAYGYFYYKITTSQTLLQKLEGRLDIAPVDDIEEGNVIEQVDVDEVLFLLVGVDTNDLSKVKEDKNGATGYRSDTMMLCRVNFKDGGITIMSLPRDSRVPVNGKLDKLNHAHSYGGMKLLMKTVRDFTNLDVDYYVRVDYSAVKKIVDAIGGVELDIKDRMKYTDTTRGQELYIDFQPGVQKLDGQKSIEFLRYRQYRRGDEDRVENQQYFMTELIKQTLRPRNILKLPKLFDAYLNYVDTNIDGGIIYKGISLASKLDSEKITTMTLPGVGAKDRSSGISYFYINDNEAKEVIKENFGKYLLD